jgi:predicted amidohydrolase YtcJ
VTRTLYRGGRLYAPGPPSSALVVEDDTIAWVGSDAAAAALGSVDEVVDLDGAWVTPVFVDAHVHVVAAGLARTGLDVTGARSREAVLNAVRAAAATAAPGALLWGTGWDETVWPAGDRRPPTPDELDVAAGGRPIYLARTDVHSAVAGPSLLRAAGVSGADPVVGEAHHSLRRAARSRLGPGQREEAARTFLEWCLTQGIGMVHECGGPDIGGAEELFAVRSVADSLGVDLVAYWGQAGSAGVDQARALGAHPAGDLFVDGSIGSHTAAVLEPYADVDGEGWLQLDAPAIADHVVAATAAGLQAGFHVIGDRALEAAVRGMEMAADRLGPAPVAATRHRLEHLEMCSADVATRLARLGVVASVQPAFDARWGGPGGMYAGRLGPERAERMNDFAGLAAAGVPLALGTDAPVTSATPWETLRAVTRPHQRRHSLSGRAAFTAHSRGGFRAARRDAAGVLRAGAEASFAVWTDVGELALTVPDSRVAAWSTDPRAGVSGLPDLDGAAPTCIRTVVRGRTAYEAGR